MGDAGRMLPDCLWEGLANSGTTFPEAAAGLRLCIMSTGARKNDKAAVVRHVAWARSRSRLENMVWRCENETVLRFAHAPHSPLKMSYRKTVVSARRDQKKGGKTGGLTEEQKQEIREAFDLFDTDGSGTIDAKVRRFVHAEGSC